MKLVYLMALVVICSAVSCRTSTVDSSNLDTAKDAPYKGNQLLGLPCAPNNDFKCSSSVDEVEYVLTTKGKFKDVSFERRSHGKVTHSGRFSCKTDISDLKPAPGTDVTGDASDKFNPLIQCEYNLDEPTIFGNYRSVHIGFDCKSEPRDTRSFARIITRLAGSIADVNAVETHRNFTCRAL